MVKHKIRVNPAFRGELILDIYDSTLKGGNTIFLTDEEFNKASVKAAIGKKYLIEEENTLKESDEEIIENEEEIEENEEVEKIYEPTKKPRTVKTKEDIVDDQEIDPRDFEEESNPAVWDADNKIMLDVREGAKKALSQLNGKMEMDIKTGEKINFEKEEKPKQKIKVRKTSKKTSKNLKKAQKELNEIVKNNILPIPDVGDIELMQDGEISFVDQEQEKQKIAERLKSRKKIKNNEEIE